MTWERSDNRKLDLSSYFKEKKTGHIVIEDVSFDDVKSKQKIRPIHGEGATETDSLIAEDLRNNTANIEKSP